MKKSDPPLVILAAGGTGGHIFPAEALAREMMQRGYATCLVTDYRGGKFGGDMQGVPVMRIRASALGRSFFKKLRGAIEMAIGTVQAFIILKRMKPALVVGFGGYPCVPTVFAAAKMGIPIMLHEQNAVLGRANRVLAPLARLIATSFPHVSGLQANINAKTALVGTPVRPAIVALHDKPYPFVSADSPLRLLVVGGSLGAQVFSTVVPKAISLLPDALRKRVLISQQCRAGDIENVRQIYSIQGMRAELATFFNDIPERLSNCHLAICRSGASTVAELCAAGRPAILVPYPHAIADEQKANAQYMAEAGAGWLIPENALTPEALAVRLESLLAVPGTLSQAADAARSLSRVNAAKDLADLAAGMIDIPSGSGENGPTPAAPNRGAAQATKAA
jgi:UDP-N-acetylglucosamine--N-acetylmuramyl-(pentapeptide) pyrophosphoryl-undecaprenol N-acetylglucosamine transferase